MSETTTLKITKEQLTKLNRVARIIKREQRYTVDRMIEAILKSALYLEGQGKSALQIERELFGDNGNGNGGGQHGAR